MDIIIAFIVIWFAILIIVVLIKFLKSYKSSLSSKQRSESFDKGQLLVDKSIKDEQRRVIDNYYIAIKNYEKLISEYRYEHYQISEYEMVYNIEGSYVVYIGVYNESIEKTIYSFGQPYVLIEELTYNNLFKFNATKFGKIFQNSYYDFRVIRFGSLKAKYLYKENYLTKFFYCDEKLPQLKLLERAKNWEGVPCHYIIVELYDENGSAATIKPITNNQLEREANAFCRQLENFTLRYDPINKITNRAILEKLSQMKNKFKEKQEIDKNLIWTLRGHLRYFFISENTNDFDLQTRGAELLDSYNNGKIENVDWIEYGRFDGRWKSEFLVFEYCQKIYGENDVFFQYSPSFLGHMSYDVFIVSKNTAIEYQGKQHFVPVEFFGGEEHYRKQIERDNRKMRLSKENGIKLIYINYNEVISENLIKERVG